MPLLARVRELWPAGGGALNLWFVLGLAACDTAPTGDGAPFVLTTRGNYVQSHAPRGIEVTLGSKLIRPADEADRLDRTSAVRARFDVHPEYSPRYHSCGLALSPTK